MNLYETKIEDSEKAGSRRELNPGHLWGSTPGDCWPFHFPLFSPHNIEVHLFPA